MNMVQEDQSANPTTTTEGAEPAAPAAKNALARTSLVLGLCGIVAFVVFGIVPVLAIVFGLFALRRIRRSGGALPGRKEAVAGIALGAVETVALIVLVATGTMTLTLSFGDTSVLDGKYRDNGIAFEYPSNWDEVSELTVEKTSGDADQLFQAAVARADRDMIMVQAYRMSEAFSEDDAEQTLGDLDDQLAGALGDDGDVLSGPTRVEVNALPGYSYTVEFRSEAGVDHSRITFLFDGTTQYFVNCQHQDHAEQVAKACAQVLDTFHTT